MNIKHQKQYLYSVPKPWQIPTGYSSRKDELGKSCTAVEAVGVGTVGVKQTQGLCFECEYTACVLCTERSNMESDRDNTSYCEFQQHNYQIQTYH